MVLRDRDSYKMATFSRVRESRILTFLSPPLTKIQSLETEMNCGKLGPGQGYVFSIAEVQRLYLWIDAEEAR